MCDNKQQETKPLVAQGTVYDFWLNDDDDYGDDSPR